jgi:hypothetical protein
MFGDPVDRQQRRIRDAGIVKRLAERVCRIGADGIGDRRRSNPLKSPMPSPFASM